MRESISATPEPSVCDDLLQHLEETTMSEPLSRVQLFAAPWTAAHQAAWDSPGKNTGVGCHALLQGIFPTTQQSNQGLLQVDSLPAELPGKPQYRCVNP